MTDSWVFLIREDDWNSDAYLDVDPSVDLENDPSMAAHTRFAAAVTELGAKISGAAALQNAKYGGYVEVGQDGSEPVYTDAPFTDTNEVITGFYQVDCDEPTARKIAAMVPSGNIIEWRKVHPFG